MFFSGDYSIAVADRVQYHGKKIGPHADDDQRGDREERASGGSDPGAEDGGKGLVAHRFAEDAVGPGNGTQGGKSGQNVHRLPTAATAQCGNEFVAVASGHHLVRQQQIEIQTIGYQPQSLRRRSRGADQMFSYLAKQVDQELAYRLIIFYDQDIHR